MLQHLLVPELAPRRNTISEYANADVGWLMVAGFLAWALSLAATADLARRDGQALLAACFAVAALGMLVRRLLSDADRRQCPARGRGALDHRPPARPRRRAVMVALFAATAVAAWRIAWPAWFRRWALALLAFAVIVGGALLAGGDDVGGLRQRLLVLAGCAAQAALVIALGERAQAGTGASSSASRRSSGSSSG